MEDQRKYRRLVEKLNHLIMIQLDIAYPISVVSQSMSAPQKVIGMLRPRYYDIWRVVQEKDFCIQVVVIIAKLASQMQIKQDV